MNVNPWVSSKGTLIPVPGDSRQAPAAEITARTWRLPGQGLVGTSAPDSSQPVLDLGEVVQGMGEGSERGSEIDPKSGCSGLRVKGLKVKTASSGDGTSSLMSTNPTCSFNRQGSWGLERKVTYSRSHSKVIAGFRALFPDFSPGEKGTVNTSLRVGEVSWDLCPEREMGSAWLKFLPSGATSLGLLELLREQGQVGPFWDIVNKYELSV